MALRDGRLIRHYVGLALMGLLIAASTGQSVAISAPRQDWPVYGGASAGDRYSPLDQINRTNVKSLKQAWRIETGPGGLQDSPIIVGRMAYILTPKQVLLALDGATGKQIWSFDPGVTGVLPSRGVSYWTDGKSDRRILMGAMGALWALNADTGKPISSFGQAGQANMREGLGSDPAATPVFMTTPGSIYKDLIIVGFRTSETPPAAAGAIRAYDVRTGKLRWTFNTIPRPGEVGYDSWPKTAWRSAGAANNWTGMVVDQARGIVYAPTGSAVPDFIGEHRKGDNLFANSLLALDANSGKRIWHFQTTHHDIWDRDLPSPPVLLTVKQKGQSIDAVAQASKQGFVFLFNRATGKPLFPIQERAFPKSDIPGEQTSPTQPIPLKPAPFARQTLTADMLTTRTAEAHSWAVKAFASLRSDGPYVPFGLDRETVVFPGFDGGAEWGGQAVDRKTGVFYINSNDVPWLAKLRKAATNSDAGSGASIYEQQCAACHGTDRKGSGKDFPDLSTAGSRLTSPELNAIIVGGRGRMPGFPQLSSANLEALISFLRQGPAASAVKAASTGATAEASIFTAPTPNYVFTGYKKFQDPDGYPAVKPPWGQLSAIDLNTGAYLWQVPLGEYPDLVAQGIRNTGSENYGGPIITAGGIVVIAATIFDRKIRAFDSKTGAQLWEEALPYAGNATPATYAIDGRQYILIATSGARDRTGPQGSAYVAFALPN